MRLRKNDGPNCNYCMEIFEDFEEQLRKNATEYIKNICTFENSIKFQKTCLSWVDSIPVNLINKFILNVNAMKIC